MCDGVTRCDGEEDEAGCGKQKGREGGKGRRKG